MFSCTSKLLPSILKTPYVHDIDMHLYFCTITTSVYACICFVARLIQVGFNMSHYSAAIGQ